MAVQIPYEDWKLLTQENEKLKQLLITKPNPSQAFGNAREKTLAERRRANRGMVQGLVVIADNFDDPLEDFEEYI